MASIASAALEGRRNGRVLMLGLGGGTIAADIMMSEPIDWSLQVTCVEADEDTAEAARLYFLPLMFEHANAMGGGAGAGAGAGGSGSSVGSSMPLSARMPLPQSRATDERAAGLSWQVDSRSRAVRATTLRPR